MVIDDKMETDEEVIKRILDGANTGEDRKHWANPDEFETLLRNGATPSIKNLLQTSRNYVQEASYQEYTFITVTDEKIDYDSFKGETQ